MIDLISDAYIGGPFPMGSGNVYVIEAEAQGSADLPFKQIARRSARSSPLQVERAALPTSPPPLFSL